MRIFDKVKVNDSRPWSENDVFPVITVGVEGHLAAAVEGESVVSHRAEQPDDCRTVFASGFNQHGGTEPLQQGPHLAHDDEFVALDVALDEIQPRQMGEQLAAAPHFGCEFHVCLAARVVHEILPGTQVTARARRIVAHADGFVLRAEGERVDFHVAAAAQVAAQHLADRGHGLDRVDASRRTRQPRKRAGVITEVGAEVHADIAFADQLRQVVDVLRSRSETPDSEPLEDEEHPADRPKITFERKQAVEYPMQQTGHCRQSTSLLSTSVTKGL